MKWGSKLKGSTDMEWKEVEPEQNDGRRKLMKKIRAIAVVMAMTVFLSGCYDYGRDITIICPVINYMAVDGGAIVIYEMDGERREKKFLEKDVYACDESSRIIAVGKVYEDGSKSLRLYLYLSEEDYAQYTKYRFDLN
nr:MAG TPA: outer membrane protein assembly factor [Caudoviricetes sp.]